MSLELLLQHRHLWEAKPVLQEVYAVWFDALLAELPEEASVLEVGAGPGLLSAYARRRRRGRWIASDIIAAPWNQVVADGQRLPFASGAFGAVVSVDLVHHLAEPATFFSEVARILAPSGLLVTVEPWTSPFSYPIYRFLHQEGCRDVPDPWKPFEERGGRGKAPFDGDGGTVSRLVRRAAAEQWAALGFRPPRVTLFNGFAYLLSLGFRRRSLLPSRAVPLFMSLDRATAAWTSALALRALLVWRRSC